MVAPYISTGENQNRSKVSVFARFVAASSYMIASAGAGLSAFLVVGIMRAMRMAEGAGISVVAGAMWEANVVLLVALYLGVICGIAAIIVNVVRLMVTTTTSSPPGWFFLIAGVLGLLPAALLWQAESLLIDAIMPASIGGVSSVASIIQLLLILAMIAAPVAILVLLTGSLLPISSRSRGKYGPLIFLVVVELALIMMTVAFQIRTSWLRQLALEDTM